MLTVKGTLVGVLRTEKMKTKNGNPYQVLQILSQDEGKAVLFMVRDYTLIALPLNKAVELPLYVSAFVNKAGAAVISYVNNKKP